MSDSVVSVFRDFAANLPPDATAYDQFNREIQSLIEIADAPLAIALAVVKLEANRRIYWANHS